MTTVLLIVIAVGVSIMAANVIAVHVSYFRLKLNIRRRRRWREWHREEYEPQQRRPTIVNFPASDEQMH